MSIQPTVENDGEPSGRTAHVTDGADALVALCRTVVGDSLRSVIHFTPRDFDLLYLRRDLGPGAPEGVRTAKLAVVNSERLGFTSVERYETAPAASALAPAFGDYGLTVRVFEHGLVGRVIVGDQGVLLTTDDVDVTRFEEFAVAIRRYLGELSG